MIGIIIQARMGSSRLPGKVLKKIGDKNLLEHILFRLRFLNNTTCVVVATSFMQGDDEIVKFCENLNVDCFRGPEDNVLERYYLCSKFYKFDHIVRLTADNPFIDIEELDNLISLHIDSGADYSRSFKCLPKGVGSEIFKFKALKDSYKNGYKPNHIEHVNEYIEENEDKFFVAELKVCDDKNRPDISLTVDTMDDYKKACFIVQNSTSDYISTQEAIKLCLEYV